MSFFFGPAAGVAAETCAAPDNVEHVSGKAHCLALKTFMPEAGARTLVIALHGDLSRGDPVDYVFSLTRRAAEFGAIGVAMMCPGYTGVGRKSSGVRPWRESCRAVPRR